MTIETMTAKEILAVPQGEPERLFGDDPRQIPDLFRALAKRWHPDRNPSPEAAVVFAHIGRLKLNAAALTARGEWRRRGVATFEAVSGRRFEMKVKRRRDFELGEIHIADHCIAYALRREHADLFEAGAAAMAHLSLRGEAMREVFATRLPRKIAAFETADRLVMVLAKTPDQILLADLIGHLGGRLDPRHAAWIVSDLECLACYLALPFVSLVHPALGPDTLLVSPRRHMVTIAGGWPYAVEIGDRLNAAPGRIADHIPAAFLSAGKAEERLTLEAVRLTACECLGHANPVTARRDATIPRPFARWLFEPPAPDTQQDYQSWIIAREASFGPRKFIDLAVDPAAVYAAA